MPISILIRNLYVRLSHDEICYLDLTWGHIGLLEYRPMG